MKKYYSLSELLIDYREFNNLTQLDIASKLNIDTRTVSRWERGVSLIKFDKVDDVVEALFLPHQVLQNLNSEHPIAIFYDVATRTYSFSLIGTQIADSQMFKSDLPVEEERIIELSAESDIEFINEVQKLRTDRKPLNSDLIHFAAKVLPELNLVLFDQAGFYAGHVSFLPLTPETYRKLKDKTLDEEKLTISDLDDDLSDDPKIFYFYSLYADSIAHAYYLMSRVLTHFKINEFKNYLIAGMAYRQDGLNVHKEMGLKLVWEEKQNNESHPKRMFLEGNYDMYLFGKMT